MPEGTYEGPMCFDSDLECHRAMVASDTVDHDGGRGTEPGPAVVTDDGGQTWRYAAVDADGNLDPREMSHNDRYDTLRIIGRAQANGQTLVEAFAATPHLAHLTDPQAAADHAAAAENTQPIVGT